jgi:predicted TIM-barrel fold metal-dependent hydrolase
MEPAIADLRLVDAHCHAVTGGRLDPAAFAQWCTEASVPAPPGVSYLDTQLGLAVRRWCAPVLDLPPRVSADAYLARRGELDPDEVTRRLLTAAGLDTLLLDTGLRGTDLLDPAQVGAAAGAGVEEVVRLEYVAERVAAGGVTAADFGARLADALVTATAAAVATKSIAAYRHGLDLDPARPSAAQVRAAAGAWLGDGAPPPDAGRPRLRDPVLLRHLLWCAVDVGLPIQLHTGFGDADAALARADPALLQPFCAAVAPTGVPLVLLHCYPYHRQAGWLAAVYPHVYVDIGLTVVHLGVRATAALAEFLELAPFGKVLYSSDAYGLPELYLVGAAQFRASLAHIVGGWVDDGAVSGADAARVAALVGAGNARRVYRLPPSSTDYLGEEA